MSRLSVVVAAYDEEQNVEPLTRRLDRALSAEPVQGWELIYVVEGTDRTREILERLSGEIPNMRVIYRRNPQGLGGAFREGFRAVSMQSDAIVTLDADLNHQPEEIPRLLTAWQERRADILVGSRFLAGSSVEGTPWWKRLLSGGMNRAMRLIYGIDIHDKTSGFRIYRAEVLRAIPFDNDGFAFLPELLVRANQAGFRIVEEPITFICRQHGRSKMEIGRTCLSYLRLLRTRLGKRY